MTLGRPTKRRHHFRPILHLRHFAAADELVWVLDKSTGKKFRQTPTNVGYETYLYAPEDGDRPHDDEVERWLERYIDRPAASVLHKLVAGTPITDVERVALAKLMAAQGMRTPKARDILVPLFQSGMEFQYVQWNEDVDGLIDAIHKDSGVRYSSE